MISWVLAVTYRVNFLLFESLKELGKIRLFTTPSTTLAKLVFLGLASWIASSYCVCSSEFLSSNFHTFFSRCSINVCQYCSKLESVTRGWSIMNSIPNCIYGIVSSFLHPPILQSQPCFESLSILY